MSNSAPVAPGRLGEAIEPALIQRYLGELDTWLRDRRTELDVLDALALDSGRGSEITDDMSLALALWKAITDRNQLLNATWDGGRVLTQERERISALIWGRLDGASVDMPGGLAVSLPEACRLNDALTGQLKSRLALVPTAAESAGRIRELRAQLARIQDQLALEPDTTRETGVSKLAELKFRLQSIEARAEQGADVEGSLGPLEIEATTVERDLIVGNAQRRAARSQALSARELRADLELREAALAKLAATCVETVDPAPRYAVPDVAALGAVPETPEEIGAYLSRLDRVSQAMELAQHKYADALEAHAELVGLLDAQVAKANALGLAELPDLVESERAARALLARKPSPISVARQLVLTYQAWIQHAQQTGDRP